jgi:hypothetical protein
MARSPEPVRCLTASPYPGAWRVRCIGVLRDDPLERQAVGLLEERAALCSLVIAVLQK